jgi:hypothetical protein
VYLTHGLPYVWMKNFIRKKIKDPQFISSVKFAIGVFTIPVYYLLLTLIFYLFTNDTQWSWAFFASMPVALFIFAKLTKK